MKKWKFVEYVKTIANRIKPVSYVVVTCLQKQYCHSLNAQQVNGKIISDGPDIDIDWVKSNEMDSPAM